MRGARKAISGCSPYRARRTIIAARSTALSGFVAVDECPLTACTMASITGAHVATATDNASEVKLHGASGFEAACSSALHAQKKKRNKKRKYTRTQEAWEARAAKRRAKLTAKYGDAATSGGDADVGSSTSQFERGIAADYVERVMACARNEAEYIDVHRESAILLREHIARALRNGDHGMAAAYAEGALTISRYYLVH